MLKKSEIYDNELVKLREIFEGVDEVKRKLVDGLIEDAAFLKAENTILRESLSETGMVKIHPQHPEMQKVLPTASQYLKNINSYSVVIKTLNGILQKDMTEHDDDFDDFMNGEKSNE